jgi:chaperonin GroEL (HSP60 family)
MEAKKHQVKVFPENTLIKRGLDAIIFNFDACFAVGRTIETTYGPKGKDKLLYDENRTIVTNGIFLW